MMFQDGDPGLPNCYEHYNPVSGQPSVYRGVDDYQHSWVVDLIIKYVAGLRVGASHIEIDPLPFGLSYFILEEVIVRGHTLTIRMEGKVLVVKVDGRQYFKGKAAGAKIRLDI